VSGLRILSYRQVKPDWHMIRADFGVFFGYSAQQVAEKAVAKRPSQNLCLLFERLQQSLGGTSQCPCHFLRTALWRPIKRSLMRSLLMSSLSLACLCTTMRQHFQKIWTDLLMLERLMKCEILCANQISLLG